MTGPARSTPEQDAYVAATFGVHPSTFANPDTAQSLPANEASPSGAIQPEAAATGSVGSADTTDTHADNAKSASPMDAGAPPVTNAGVATIEFNAFIPGSLGSKFNSFDHPKDLKNQAAFEAALSGVSGTWLEEPGSFAGLSSGPWLFSTDDRGFGGGSHRVASTGTVDPANIGSMKARGGAFKHTTSGSSHGRWVHTGNFTSSGETGSLEGPVFKKSNVTGSQDYTDKSPDSSVVTIEASGSYPFALIAPSIDYKLVLTITRDASGNVTISGDITTNKFPFYELIINGTGQERAAGGILGVGRGECRDWTGVRRADERDLFIQPAAPGAQCASQRGLDAAGHCRAWDAGARPQLRAA